MTDPPGEGPDAKVMRRVFQSCVLTIVLFIGPIACGREPEDPLTKVEYFLMDLYSDLFCYALPQTPFCVVDQDPPRLPEHSRD